MTPFSKYQGIGNDFVVLDGAAALAFDPRTAPALCDRHFGIGADGVLLVLPPHSSSAVARMRVINADGSEPEMCGNGLRCVALSLGTGTFVIDTGAGAKTCVVTAGEESAQVTIDMGEVRFVESRRFELPSGALTASLVDAGNPHAIFFDPVAVDERARVGALLERHPSFANRTNVEFARIAGGRIELVVWERGVGFTLACGTGACATVVAAWQLGLVSAPQIPVDLPGGTLVVERGEGQRVSMTGPARRVFSGTFP